MTDLNGRMMERTVIQGKPALVPADLMAEEWILKQPIGAKIKMTGRKPRNPKHHSKLFALLRKCVENTQDIWADETALLEELKHATGLSIERRCVLLDDALPTHIKTMVENLELLAKTHVTHARLLTGAATLIKALYEQTLTIHIIGSIAFDAMDQDRFNDWYEKALQLLAVQVLGVAPDALRQEIEEMIFRQDGWRQPRGEGVQRGGDGGDRGQPDPA
jgi:hypothetical protein